MTPMLGLGPLYQGKKVLLLLPSSSNKLIVQWQGPYEIVEKVEEVDYHIQLPGQGMKLYHVNLLKAWQDADETGWYQAEIDWDEEGRKQSQELQRQVAMGLPASEWQLHQIQQVLGEYPDVFQDVPGWVRAVVHWIPTPPGKVVWVPYCPTPVMQKQALEQEIRAC